MTSKPARITAALAVVQVLAFAPAIANAQDAPSHASPPWDTLVGCAEKTNPSEELNCYRAAMHDAGYAPSAAKAAEKQHKFGFALPSINMAKLKPKNQGKTAEADKGQAQAAQAEDNDNEATVELDQVTFIPPANKMLLVLSDGAIWEQLDNEVVTPQPRKGLKIKIRRTQFGGYMCQFDRLTQVRCRRLK